MVEFTSVPENFFVKSFKLLIHGVYLLELLRLNFLSFESELCSTLAVFSSTLSAVFLYKLLSYEPINTFLQLMHHAAFVSMKREKKSMTSKNKLKLSIILNHIPILLVGL